MLESMTAYGSTECDINNTRITIEIKSVNHRFFEARVKLPYSLNKLDPIIRKILKDKLSRGNVDCYVKASKICDETVGGGQTVSVDYNLLGQYVKTLEDVKFKFNLADSVKISDLVRIPNLFVIGENDLPEEVLEKKFIPTLEKCLMTIIEMQKKEGSSLKTAIEKYLSEIENNFKTIEEKSKDMVKITHHKLSEKIQKLIGNSEITEDRILVEAGILAEKLDVAEELDRLKSHLKQFRDELNNSNEVGRKLDFVVQEINREVNTIASKAEDKDVVYICVESKTLIEKIREQIQNVK